MRVTEVLVSVVLALGIAAGGAFRAEAQPAAPPGYICVISNDWCWASTPGRPGAPCRCATSAGPVSGTLR